MARPALAAVADFVFSKIWAGGVGGGSGGFFSNPYVGLIIGLLLLAFAIYAMFFDAGIKSLGPCSLITFKIKADRCVNIACPGTCSATTGPYPSWMPLWMTPLRQDTSCVCSVSGGSALSGLMKIFEEMKSTLGGINDAEKARSALIELIGRDLTPEEWKRVKQIFDKVMNGEPLSDEEQAELEKLRVPP